MYVLTVCVVCLLVTRLETRVLTDSYAALRAQIIQEENSLALGGKLTLTDEEKEANEILMRWKRKEIDEAFYDPEYYNFSKHYFMYKEHIESSKVYQIIRKMPKGAALHVHSSYMLDTDGLIELTYEDHLYACYHNDLKLQFSDGVPTLPCPVKWKLLSELRAASDNATRFDEELKKHFTLVTNDEEFMDAHINHVWKEFERIHKVIKSLISYRPVREKYFYKALQKFYEDRVTYIEVRSGLSHLYELDGVRHEKIYMAKLFKEVTNKFIKDHPDFIGVKIIVTSYRRGTLEKVYEDINLAKMVKAEMPEMFAGFDLVGQEDLGRPLLDFLPLLKDAKNDLDLYLHAGETAWFGTSTDENLVDAILLDSKRIGHAYALLKHPSLLKEIIQKDICLEVNVISNAVLSLVQDVRNHPLATYLALGLPIVLSSDDPVAWEADPLSHDFYIAFVGVASRNYDIRMLKQLALNSIKYSALDDRSKEKYLQVFNKDWVRFIEDLRSMKCDPVCDVSTETQTQTVAME